MRYFSSFCKQLLFCCLAWQGGEEADIFLPSQLSTISEGASTFVMFDNSERVGTMVLSIQR